MDYFSGLDVSVKETSICIVDEAGRIVREVKVASEPDALLQVLSNPTYCFKRIGLEAGPLSQWLFSALGEANLPVICVETRHMRAVLKAQINKTDRNDARGMAQMMRVGLYRPVHVKTLRSQKLRMLLTHRKLLQSKAIAIENDLRGTLRNFGLKVGIAGRTKFEARIAELVGEVPDLAALVEPLLVVRRVLQSGERDRPGHIALRRRDDAGHALPGGAEHAGAFDAMVLAQGLGDADRQAPRHEESDCRAGPQVSGGHAPHLDGWDSIPLDQASSSTVSDQIN